MPRAKAVEALLAKARQIRKKETLRQIIMIIVIVIVIVMIYYIIHYLYKYIYIYSIYYILLYDSFRSGQGRRGHEEGAERQEERP